MENVWHEVPVPHCEAAPEQLEPKGYSCLNLDVNLLCLGTFTHNKRSMAAMYSKLLASNHDGDDLDAANCRMDTVQQKEEKIVQAADNDRGKTK